MSNIRMTHPGVSGYAVADLAAFTNLWSGLGWVNIGPDDPSTGGVATGGFAPAWVATTAYAVGQVAISPAGGLIVRKTAGTSRASYDATEKAAWRDSDAAYVAAFLPDAYGTVDRTGTTDTAAAIQGAVNAANAAGGGVVYLAPGTYRLDTQIAWKSSVSLLGSGWATVLAPHGTVPAIEQLTGTLGTPVRDCHFSDFAIDGSAQAGTYATSIKGIRGQFWQRCSWRRLYIHDCGASGLGVDYLRDCDIEGVVANGNGRLYSGDFTGNIGASGIGIGTGQWEVENTTVANCHATGNVNNGIFFERQGSGFYSRGYKVIGCHTAGNRIGIADRGVEGLLVDDCTMETNTVRGFHCDLGRAGKLRNSIAYDNGDDGILIEQDAGRGYVVEGCETYSNTGYGIKAYAQAAAVGRIRLTRNLAHDNDKSGILIFSGSSVSTRWSVHDNECWDNGLGGSVVDGIAADCQASDLSMRGNRCWDDQGVPTQANGIRFAASKTVATGNVRDNDVRGNGTNGILVSGTLTGDAGGVRVNDNVGYNPQGAVNILAGVGASPATVTNTSNSRRIYTFSGGTVTDISKDGITLAASTNRSVELHPGESCVITYSVKPTVGVADRR